MNTEGTNTIVRGQCAMPECTGLQEVSRYYTNSKGVKVPLYRKYCSKHKKKVYGRYKDSPSFAPKIIKTVKDIPELKPVIKEEKYVPRYGCGCVREGSQFYCPKCGVR